MSAIGSTNPFDSLESAVVFHSRDWSENTRDAWIYGIIIGWGDAALEELKASQGWNDETVNRLNALHESFQEIKRRFQP